MNTILACPTELHRTLLAPFHVDRMDEETDNFVQMLSSEMMAYWSFTGFDPAACYSMIRCSQQFATFTQSLHARDVIVGNHEGYLKVERIISYTWTEWSRISAIKRRRRQLLIVTLLHWRRNLISKSLLVWSKHAKKVRMMYLERIFFVFQLNRVKCLKSRKIQTVISTMFGTAFDVFRLKEVVLCWQSVAESSCVCRFSRLRRSLHMLSRYWAAHHQKNEMQRRSLYFWIGCIYTRLFHHWRIIHRRSKQLREKGVEVLRSSSAKIASCISTEIAMMLILNLRKLTRLKSIRDEIMACHRRRICSNTFLKLKIEVDKSRCIQKQVVLRIQAAKQKCAEFAFVEWIKLLRCILHLNHIKAVSKRRVFKWLVDRRKKRGQKLVNSEKALGFFWAHCQPNIYRKVFDAFGAKRSAALNVTKELAVRQSKHEQQLIRRMLKAWISLRFRQPSTEALRKWHTIAIFLQRCIRFQISSSTALLSSSLRSWNNITKAFIFDRAREQRAALYLFMRASADSSAEQARESIAKLIRLRSIITRTFRLWMSICKSRSSIQVFYGNDSTGCTKCKLRDAFENRNSAEEMQARVRVFTSAPVSLNPTVREQGLVVDTRQSKLLSMHHRTALNSHAAHAEAEEPRFRASTSAESRDATSSSGGTESPDAQLSAPRVAHEPGPGPPSGARCSASWLWGLVHVRQRRRLVGLVLAAWRDRARRGAHGGGGHDRL
jgi:hypothetical protein